MVICESFTLTPFNTKATYKEKQDPPYCDGRDANENPFSEGLRREYTLIE